MFSVLDFGAVADGRTVCRAAFQAAVDECAAAGGGTVLVPAGTYLLGTVEMRSHVHIHFEAGATVLGSAEFERDYLPREEFVGGKYQDDSHSFFDHSLFLAKDCCDIGFSGHGRIDMQGVFTDLEHGQYYRTIKIFTLRSCRNVILTDLTLLRAADLAIWMVDCEHVRIRGLSLDVLVDGITPDGCRDVVISDCFVNADDDAIVLKSSFSMGRFLPCEHIAISNCIISSNASAFKIGTETNGDFRHISLSGCTIRHVRRAGIAIESVDGANIVGITISNIAMYNVGTPFYVRLGARMRAPEGTPIGSISDVKIQNVFADNPQEPYDTHFLFLPGQQCIGPKHKAFEFSSQILGMVSHPIKNLTMKNVTLVTVGGRTPENSLPWPLPECDTAYPDVNKFGWDKALPASCLVMRHVHGARFENVTMRTRQPDSRPIRLFDDVDLTEK